jgi:acyl-CoA synthetase (AMP-forming)/AMP-acid ligase II
MIATATPADLRAAPDTAGTPADGTDIRILDAEFRVLPTGEVGTIYVRNSTQFDGYTKGPPRRARLPRGLHRARVTLAISTTPAGSSWWAATTR